MSNEFAGKIVLIAGAGTGIGKGMAQAFVQAGAGVILGGRRADVLKATANEIGAKAVSGDFADPAQLPLLLEHVGPLDVLVVNYGATDTAPGFDTAPEEWERLMTANLSGPAHLSRAAAAAMKARGQGVILFIGSICGREVLGAPIAYNVGKSALMALTKTMAHELGPHGVRVNMISPGNVLFEGGRWAAKREANAAQVEQMLQAKVPLRRFGTPDDIAQAALFLCSDRAAFVTGVDLVVDGGQTVSFS
jgi:3-oxoacyl-[acyl-carrier protein] reductase